MVYDQEFRRILFCKRKKRPYIGKLNFPGGKWEEGEEYIAYANNVGGYNINVTTLENGVVMVTYDVDVWYIEAYFDYYEHY